MKHILERLTWKRAGFALLALVLAAAITFLIFICLGSFMEIVAIITKMFQGVQEAMPVYAVPPPS